MVILKPLIIVNFSTSSLSGGYLRLYEILKRGKAAGLDYVVVTDSDSLKNAAKIFPDFMKIIANYKVVTGRNGRIWDQVSPLKKLVNEYKRIFRLALIVSQTAKEEGVELIVYPSEGKWGILTSFLASLLSSVPWTAIFQPGASSDQPDLFQPSYALAPINPFNVLSHFKARSQDKRFRTISKIALCIDFLLLLKASEKTVILTVSKSVSEDIGYLAPRVKTLPITPGNGINLIEYSADLPKHLKYHAIFFGRLLPEKGFFDLVEIWKKVVEKLPNAKLAVCGIVEKPSIFEEFIKKTSRQNLKNNVEILGQQNRTNLIHIIAKSHLTLNPSYVDAFSLVTLESLACGTPVIAYDISAIRHNYNRCKAVFRCQVGNTECMARTIVHILTEMNRTPLAAEAKAFAALYDWNQVVKAEKEAYSLVIDQKRR